MPWVERAHLACRLPYVSSLPVELCVGLLCLSSAALLCEMSMCPRTRLFDSDILCAGLVVCVQHTSREVFACARARVDGARKFIVTPACMPHLAALAHVC